MKQKQANTISSFSGVTSADIPDPEREMGPASLVRVAEVTQQRVSREWEESWEKDWGPQCHQPASAPTHHLLRKGRRQPGTESGIFTWAGLRSGAPPPHWPGPSHIVLTCLKGGWECVCPGRGNGIGEFPRPATPGTLPLVPKYSGTPDFYRSLRPDPLVPKPLIRWRSGMCPSLHLVQLSHHWHRVS